MADQNTVAAIQRAETTPTGNIFQRFLAGTELDTRLLGMLGALALIWIGFQVISGGIFLTPRNLWNLSVQTAEVSVMATGMVLVIVTRNIDLSVGSLLGFVGMIMGLMQAVWLPPLLGLSNPFIWVIALAAGIAVGVVIGGIQGVIVAYLQVPAFIVTQAANWCGAAARICWPLERPMRPWTASSS